MVVKIVEFANLHVLTRRDILYPNYLTLLFRIFDIRNLIVMKIKKINSIVGLTLAFASVAIVTSCGLFRQKNRCQTCPKWDMIEIPSTVVQATFTIN
jgi:hypothetical protein